MWVLWSCWALWILLFFNLQNPKNKLSPEILAVMSSVMSGQNSINKSVNTSIERKGILKQSKNRASCIQYWTNCNFLPSDMNTYGSSGATVHRVYDQNANLTGTLAPCEPQTFLLEDNTSDENSVWGNVLISFENISIRYKQPSFIQFVVYDPV